MRIGDVEYTRSVVHANLATLNESEIETVNFAIGIKIRALLTRVQVTQRLSGVTTEGNSVFLENGDAIGAGITEAQLFSDVRAFPIYQQRNSLSTNGMTNYWGPRETLWWKILLPTVRIHFVDTVATSQSWQCVLHYRFAELTDDEIIEIAAQRAQE